ncbi:MAG: hypothetical protein ACR2OA_01270 [Rubripirellula sp.]
MKSESKLSDWYHRVKAELLAGWNGTYSELARAVGYSHSRRAPQVIGRLVKSFALRHPGWDDRNVSRQSDGNPGYVR